ncbi:transporter substrate-binding domain-containing protein [Halioglobus maricola]|uniref:Transporter substrate-binding domain-containing protein n=1 Tax=Halioglobus maricola TaxID=2601894 RepID=A0A5P9NNR0_9GAMM|nr:transporter substrate-binding domain-containing protein [Halioglobus maricola]QFU77432.1 transporter substrate-binding domain-containing protein [Halioglobus maricola]
MTFLTRLLALSCLISLAACGDSEQEPATNSDIAQAPAQVQPAETESPEPETTAALPFAPSADEQALQALKGFRNPWTGDLDVMEERRVVRVLTVYSPGRYYLEDNGQEKGLVKEFSMMFEKFLNKRLNRKTVKVHVIIIPMARNQLVPALLAGHGDIINASLSITPERQEQFDFSIPASKAVSEILITGPDAPALDGIDDLSGQTIYVRHSSSYRESVDTLNERLVAEGKEPVNIELVSEFLEDDDLIEMVDKGLLPWAIVDSYKPTLWKGVFTNTTVRDDIVFREGGRIAWAFRQNSPLLEGAVNDFLKKNREGTLIGNVLKNRYIRDFDWAANALDDSDYQRFLELQHIFQKYGDQYRVDYLLAAAQGYQESRLDQTARSHAGAVGVMQLLPTTARDKNVGIHDISSADSNIHAGIKYLDFLRDRYFNDPAIDTRNKTLLALAAYNTGPSRMINLRRKAERLGYDPNVWFDNVELVAAQDVGREPVQYVANIYKYYVAYRYSIDQQAGHAKARERAGMTPYRSGSDD